MLALSVTLVALVVLVPHQLLAGRLQLTLVVAEAADIVPVVPVVLVAEVMVVMRLVPQARLILAEAAAVADLAMKGTAAQAAPAS